MILRPAAGEQILMLAPPQCQPTLHHRSTPVGMCMYLCATGLMAHCIIALTVLKLAQRNTSAVETRRIQVLERQQARLMADRGRLLAATLERCEVTMSRLICRSHLALGLAK